MGGFFAVAWTDVFQGMLIVAILVFLPIIGVIRLGGINVVFNEIGNVNILTLSPTFGYTGLLILLFTFAGMSWFFGYPGQPHILTRYMSIKDEKKLWNSTFIGMTWVIISLWGAVFIGIIGLATFKTVVDPEKVMPLLSMHLLPEWAAGVVIAAITAAIMSTADSQLLVATSSMVEDVYHKLINPQADEKKLVSLSRISVLLLSIVAFILALEGGVIYFLVAFAWGGLAASFGPLIILSLWWRRTTKWGAIVGMISGAATVIIWDKCGIAGYLQTISIHDELVIPGMLPGFLVSLCLIIVVSIFTTPPEERKLFE
jgi:sodium/proline symporter